jgi:hypothetical protein
MFFHAGLLLLTLPLLLLFSGLFRLRTPEIFSAPPRPPLAGSIVKLAHMVPAPFRG